MDGSLKHRVSPKTDDARQPSVPQMGLIYRDLRENLPQILKDGGTDSLFEARVFKDLCVLAGASAKGVTREHF
jgi:hypothetical protein